MTQRKSFVLVLAIILVLAACNKDSNPSVSPAQAKSTFSSVNQNLASELGNLNSAAGTTALTSFTSLTNVSNPFARLANYSSTSIKNQVVAGFAAVHKMFSTVVRGKNLRTQGDQPFDFNAHKGVYQWNPGTQTFDKTNTASDFVIIDFPTEGSSTNNAEFRLTAYAEQSTPNGSELYSPTLVNAAIYIGDTKEAELKLTMSYGTNDQPNQASIDYFVNPFTISLTFDDTKSTSTTETYSLIKSGQVLMGTGFTATYTDKTSGTPTAVTGYIQLMNVKFTMTIDGNKAASSNDMNDYIAIVVTIDNGSAGHVVFVTDATTGEQVPYLQYNDKTEEKLETVFADLTSQLQSIKY